MWRVLIRARALHPFLLGLIYDHRAEGYVHTPYVYMANCTPDILLGT